MDTKYQEVVSELDAREVLRYLNHLGIQNISGEVLKYFITDLKKLIKYDLQQKKGIENTATTECSGPERLHSATTFSSRLRSCQENVPLPCDRNCLKSKSTSVRDIHSAPVLGQRKSVNTVKPLRRACSCVTVEKKQDIIKDKVPASSNNNLIKVSLQPPKKKCDPVSLYHYYTSLWAKYKPNVPGENDWSELRWNVRQKMAGNVSKTKSTKVPVVQELGYIKK